MAAKTVALAGIGKRKVRDKLRVPPRAQERLAPEPSAPARMQGAPAPVPSPSPHSLRLPSRTRATVFPRMPLPRILLFVAFVLFVGRLPAARADEPFFKKGDVIAIVGGEDMVALSEYGYLELLLTRALPDYHLRFRNLAWEGDTVFEQRRDLGFPTWEEQLEKIGATVVLCQFGQMESLAGTGRVGVPPAGPGILPGRNSAAVTPGGPDAGAAAQDRSGRMPEPAGGTPTLPGIAEFIAAYEKLLVRFSGGGKRRVAIIAPLQFWRIPSIPDWMSQGRSDNMNDYSLATEAMAKKARFHFVENVNPDESTQRDGVHLSVSGHVGLALELKRSADVKEFGAEGIGYSKLDGMVFNRGLEPLRQLIIAKNRLWFDYWRVQNWAFLAGDRTNQPSSRDHLDPQKRWFPEERERFLPLIEAKEKEIDALAAKLAQP